MLTYLNKDRITYKNMDVICKTLSEITGDFKVLFEVSKNYELFVTMLNDNNELHISVSGKPNIFYSVYYKEDVIEIGCDRLLTDVVKRINEVLHGL